MELYSKKELLKELKKEYSCGGECDHCPEVLDAGSCAVLRCIRRIIDNASPVDMNTELSVAYLKGRRQGQSDVRPQGDLKSCEALKAYARKVLCGDNPTNSLLIRMFDEIIDNAPPDEIATKLQPNCNNLQQPQGDLADEVWKLYEKHQSHLATRVIEFGDELKDLLDKYQKGGAE